jgi:DNA repair protein RadC
MAVVEASRRHGRGPRAGNPEPSREDILITERMVKTGRVLGIDVVDHIIVAADRYVSLKERGNI